MGFIGFFDLDCSGFHFFVFLAYLRTENSPENPVKKLQKLIFLEY
ncbi:hypothetical protein LEP1GSC084_1069 [Leptospira interrogans serovar Medanensis str. L0448]|nr:hypothetical protein LEP1GSC099_1442 [Leptospira interrogans str. UI 08452]EMN33242.1 hypothetical protein LEP1GSC084_1069 [Leptospira interrogans serovar Medanensis str. L0448]EMN38370.1 hypothetical protein LEP1GSC085_0036 [Leptospira interrogans str. L0996]